MDNNNFKEVGCHPTTEVVGFLADGLIKWTGHGLKEEIVSYDTARLLKEKGFGVSTESVYVDHPDKDEGYVDLHTFPFALPNKENGQDGYAAPSQSLALRWLREVYHLHIEIGPLKPYKNGTEPADTVQYHATIYRIDEWDKYLEEFDHIGLAPYTEDYEKCVENAIQYCLKKLIKTE